MPLSARKRSRHLESGRFVRTDVLSRESTAVVEHERIPFPSFPYEWPPEMLWEAGALTLDLAIELAGEGLGLKDGTPFNVLFRGQPVFVDVLSVEPRAAGDPLWLARAQFIRTFLLPLAAERDFGIPLTQSLNQREGIEPEAFYRMLSPIARFRPRYIPLVSAPVWLSSRDRDGAGIHQPRRLADPEKARFILRSTLLNLRRKLARLAPVRERSSAWSDYMECDCIYSKEQFAQKERFVETVIGELGPRRVLDVGANTGHFSAMAARAGASVIAIESDPVTAGALWRRARDQKLDILPLAINLAQPTPATGWRNLECASFLERASASFDMVVMLAVVHHLLATERVPLDQILDLAAELTTDALVIEFVGPEDPMFRSLSRGRNELYAHLSPEILEQAARARFDLVRKQAITGASRWLYLFRRKRG